MIKFTVNTKNLISSVKAQVVAEQKEQLAKVLKIAVQELEEATPVLTGKAAGSWSVSITGDKGEIKNSEEYMKSLNAGSSRQAPAFFIERIMLKYGKPQGPVVDYRK